MRSITDLDCDIAELHSCLSQGEVRCEINTIECGLSKTYISEHQISICAKYDWLLWNIMFFIWTLEASKKINEYSARTSMHV
jgi:hypothetical protein